HFWGGGRSGGGPAHPGVLGFGVGGAHPAVFSRLLLTRPTWPGRPGDCRKNAGTLEQTKSYAGGVRVASRCILVGRLSESSGFSGRLGESSYGQPVRGKGFPGGAGTAFTSGRGGPGGRRRGRLAGPGPPAGARAAAAARGPVPCVRPPPISAAVPGSPPAPGVPGWPPGLLPGP